MFVPSDGIYHAALSEDPALIEYGVDQQVLLATPTTLIGLLRAVHYGWKQERIAASAREIAETGRELHRRIARFVEPLAKVGRQLGSAVTAYNEAVGSFESRVVPQLRRIEEAGASSDRSVELAGIEAAPRTLTASLAELEPERGARPPLAELDAPLERTSVGGVDDAAAASADEPLGTPAAAPADRVIRAA
jgi:DNA recombination protein RmuC